MVYDYTHYSIGELVDMLSIVNLKIFMLVDITLSAPEDIENLDMNELVKIAKAGTKAAKLNSQRSALKNAIDKMILNIEKDIKI